jgi:pimeloyl-ACP methyl ester carboxylesterase
MTTTDQATVSHTTSRDGTEIGYFTTGDGPPLVLVHGALGDHTRWDMLRPHLEPHFTVHAMDRRGRGASGDSADYDVAREVEDVAAVVNAVAETSGTAVDVLGSSAGASFAVAAAALTTHVHRLVLFEPPARQVLELLPAELLDQLDALLAADDREGLLRLAYRVLVGLSDEEIENLRAQPAWPNRLAAAHTVPRELRIPPERMFDEGQAASVTVPALVLVGAATPPPFQASARSVVDALPNARIAVLDGQGHAAEMFAPEIVAQQVIPFLA